MQRTNAWGPLLIALPLSGCFLFPSLEAFEERGSDAAAEATVGGDASDAEGVGGRCPSTAVLCDDFESGGTSLWSSSSLQNGGATDVVAGTSPAPPNGGKRVLHASIPGKTAIAYLVKALPSADLDTVAVRTRIYVAAVPPAAGNYVDLLAFRFEGGKQRAIVRLENGSKFKVLLSNQGVDLDSLSLVTEAAGRWSCVELDARLGGKVNFFLDGALRLSGPFPREATETFDQLRLGTIQSLDAFDAYFDDVVLAKYAGMATLPDAPLIGCDP